MRGNLAATCTGTRGQRPIDCAMAQLANEMVDKEIVAAGVKNERVIRAMRDTPRHEFVPTNQRDHAYFDMACRSAAARRFRRRSSSPR